MFGVGHRGVLDPVALANAGYGEGLDGEHQFRARHAMDRGSTLLGMSPYEGVAQAVEVGQGDFVEEDLDLGADDSGFREFGQGQAPHEADRLRKRSVRRCEQKELSAGFVVSRSGIGHPRRAVACELLAEGSQVGQGGFG